MIPQGREAGSSFPPCFFSLHSHLQRLLPPPAHDVTYIRTNEEHIYNTAEWHYRDRHTEKGIITHGLLRLPFLFPYTLATVTSVSPFRQPILITAPPNETIALAFLLRIQEVPGSNLDLKTLSSLLRGSLRYDHINSGTAPQILPGPVPCTYFHFIVWPLHNMS